MQRSSSVFAALIGAGVLSLTACSSTSSNALGSNDGAPPTIGIGSDVGGISGGADVRAVNAEAVDSIVMIGDSITVGATAALEEKFAELGFDDVEIVAQQDKRIAYTFGNNSSGADIAAFVANGNDQSPEERLWVVALGTNDISQYASEADVVAQIESVLESVPADSPLVWINTYFGDRPDDTALVNAAIEQVISDRGNATIGRWNQYAPIDGVLRGDGVHPNEEGAVVFASLVTATVASFLEL